MSRFDRWQERRWRKSKAISQALTQSKSAMLLVNTKDCMERGEMVMA